MCVLILSRFVEVVSQRGWLVGWFAGSELWEYSSEPTPHGLWAINQLCFSSWFNHDANDIRGFDGREFIRQSNKSKYLSSNLNTFLVFCNPNLLGQNSVIKHPNFKQFWCFSHHAAVLGYEWTGCTHCEQAYEPWIRFTDSSSRLLDHGSPIGIGSPRGCYRCTNFQSGFQGGKTTARDGICCLVGWHAVVYWKTIIQSLLSQFEDICVSTFFGSLPKKDPHLNKG